MERGGSAAAIEGGGGGGSGGNGGGGNGSGGNDGGGAARPRNGWVSVRRPSAALSLASSTFWDLLSRASTSTSSDSAEVQVGGRGRCWRCCNT